MPNPPLITLTTDFGLEDWYVAAVKAVLFSRLPAAQVIDITHLIPPGDLIRGAITLERAAASFPSGTVHLVVVDPGVGSARRMLMTFINHQWIVCPDNGLITWTWRRQGAGDVWQITWQPPISSSTFHARDIMGPVAAMLASGVPPTDLGHPIPDPLLLDLSVASVNATAGQIIHIDHFGNATTNIPAETMHNAGPVNVHAGGRNVGPLRQFYAQVPTGHPLALIGSSDLLEIALHNASAANALGLKVGDLITLHSAQ